MSEWKEGDKVRLVYYSDMAKTKIWGKEEIVERIERGNNVAIIKGKQFQILKNEALVSKSIISEIYYIRMTPETEAEMQKDIAEANREKLANETLEVLESGYRHLNEDEALSIIEIIQQAKARS